MKGTFSVAMRPRIPEARIALLQSSLKNVTRRPWWQNVSYYSDHRLPSRIPHLARYRHSTIPPESAPQRRYAQTTDSARIPRLSHWNPSCFNHHWVAPISPRLVFHSSGDFQRRCHGSSTRSRRVKPLYKEKPPIPEQSKDSRRSVAPEKLPETAMSDDTNPLFDGLTCTAPSVQAGLHPAVRAVLLRDEWRFEYQRQRQSARTTVDTNVWHDD